MHVIRAVLARTPLVVLASAVLFTLAGRALGAEGAAVLALVLAAAGFALWRRSCPAGVGKGAAELDAGSAPALFDDLRMLASRAGLPTPRLFLVEDERPYAFAVGHSRFRAAIVLNRGLLDLLSREERRGVLAHEIAHLRHHDTLLLGATARLVGGVDALTRHARRRPGPIGAILSMLGLAFAVLARLLHLGIGRHREFLADRHGAELCGDALPLASALRKIADWERRNGVVLSGPPAGLAGLARTVVSTHPDCERRIAALLRHKPFRADAGQKGRWEPFRRSEATLRPAFLGGNGIVPDALLRSLRRKQG